MAKATIYDVSELAEVSIATVSRVLNAPDRVSAETRSRVISAIDELEFVPKFEALARARKMIGRIGILTPAVSSDSFVDRLRGIIATLGDESYEAVIYDVGSAAQRDGYLIRLPTTREIDGLIVVDLPVDKKAAARLRRHHLPAVHIRPSSHGDRPGTITTIVHDDPEGGRMAAQYLFSRGHRTVAYVGDADSSAFLGTYRDQKLDTFRQTLALNGIALPDRYVQLGQFGMEPARQSARRLLDLPSPPTAIFAGSDTQALGVLRAVREQGLAIPGDVAVMGFDNIAVAAYIGLTTICQQLTASGRLAVELLTQQIAEDDVPTQTVSLPFELMERESA